MARNRSASREDEGLGEEILEAEEDGDAEKLQELYEENKEWFEEHYHDWELEEMGIQSDEDGE